MKKSYALLWVSASVLALGYGGIAAAQTPASPAKPKPASAAAEAAQHRRRRRRSPNPPLTVRNPLHPPPTIRKSTRSSSPPSAARRRLQTHADLGHGAHRRRPCRTRASTTSTSCSSSRPAATVNNFGQGIDFNIRGIGKAEHNSQTTTGVITYRDGVATFPGYFTGEPYYDIAQRRDPARPARHLRAARTRPAARSSSPRTTRSSAAAYHGYVAGQLGNYSDFGFAGRGQHADQRHAGRAHRVQHRERATASTTSPAPARGTDARTAHAAARASACSGSRPARSPCCSRPTTATSTSAPIRPIRCNAPNDLFNITANAELKALDRFVRSVLKVDYEFANGIKLRSVTGYQDGNTPYRADLDGTSAGQQHLPRLGRRDDLLAGIQPHLARRGPAHLDRSAPTARRTRSLLPARSSS